MGQIISYNVLLSHSAKDKAGVRPLAGRLRRDGPNVWFDEWVLAPGDNIPAKIEKRPAYSNILRKKGGQMCGCVERTPSCEDTPRPDKYSCCLEREGACCRARPPKRSNRSLRKAPEVCL